MLRTAGSTAEIRVLELVAAHTAGRLETDAERAQLALARGGQKPDDQARIQPARQQYAGGYVRDHASLYGLLQLGEQLLLPFLRRQRRALAREARSPINLIALAAVCFDDAQSGRR
jgi:hypothetical protein